MEIDVQNSLLEDQIDMLTVIDYKGIKKKQHRWKCRCMCGETCVKTQRYLLNPNVFHSCGCYGRKTIRLLDNVRKIGNTVDYRRKDISKELSSKTLTKN